MRTIVRHSPLEAPLLDTADAHTVELREPDGRLVALILFPPGEKTFLFSSAQEPGFETFARGLGFELKT